MALEAFKVLHTVHSVLFGKNAAGEGENVKITDESVNIDASPFIVSVTTSDVTVYSPPLLGVRASVTGNIKVRSNGADVTISNAQVGEQIAGNIDMVYATGTTATGIIGWKRA